MNLTQEHAYTRDTFTDREGQESSVLVSSEASHHGLVMICVAERGALYTTLTAQQAREVAQEILNAAENAEKNYKLCQV